MQNIELYDDKTENYVLSQVFKNSKTIEILKDIHDILDKKEDIDFWQNINFLSTLYKKVWFINESKLDNETKTDLMILFFWDDILSIDYLPWVIKWYAKDIEKFKNLDIEKKGFIFYLIELVVDKKINIHDDHYLFFMESKKDRELICEIIIELCNYWLELLKKDIDYLLDQQHTFFDKYFSFNENYLKDKELEWFRKHFYEMVQYMYIYLTSKNEIKNKISQIQTRIENKLKFCT